MTLSTRPPFDVRRRFTTARRTHEVTDARGPVSEPLVALAGTFLLGLWYPIGGGVASSTTVGDLVLFLLIPVWWKGLRSAVGGKFLAMVSALAVASGIVLLEFAKIDHTTSLGTAADSVMLVFGTVAGAGFVLWGLSSVPLHRLGACYGVGLIVQTVLVGTFGFSTDGWKSGLAVGSAVTVLSLVLAVRPGSARTAAEVAGVLGLALASALLNSRSYLATFLLTLTLVVWQHRPTRATARRSWTWVAVCMVGLAAGMYQLGTSLLVDGYLGRAAQVRTIQQLHTAGSLILGGRPELGASIALFEYQPTGFGAGVIANPADVRAAKIGLAQLNYDPNNGYVDKFMFGGQIELHSTIGDLWAWFGLAGLALCITLGYIVLRGLATAVADRTGSALGYFLCWWTLWNIFFSPFLAAAPTMLLVLAVALKRRSPASPPPAYAVGTVP